MFKHQGGEFGFNYRLIRNGYVAGLQTLGTLFDFELNLLALFEVPETFTLDSGVVNEYVLTTLAGDETIAFAAVEPFYRAGSTF